MNDTRFKEVVSAPHGVRAANLEGISVRDESGVPLRYENSTEGGNTVIWVKFDGRAEPGESITYYLEFSALDLLNEEAPKFEEWFGGANLQPDYPFHDSL